MKKVISLVLSVCLMATMLFTGAFTASAGTTVKDITADLSKSVRVGDETTGITMTMTNSDDGSVDVSFSNYKKMFMSGDAASTGTLWLKGAILALKNSNDAYLALSSGKTYSINVIYDVTKVSTTDTKYVPQIGIGYNNNTTLGNAANDNGTIMLAAKKHSATGSYSLSAVVTKPKTYWPLRLVFGGQGIIKVKSVTVREITQTVTASDTSKTVDLTLSDDISVKNAAYSGFTPATATDPLKITVNGTVKNQFMDGTNDWANTWHANAHWIKTGLVALNYDESSHPVLDSSKAYQVVVNYKVTESSATTKDLYPEIAIVRNNNKSTTGDNGTFTLAATRINPSKVGQNLTFTTGIFNVSGKDGFPIRLAFAGKGSFEVSSVVIKEIPHYATVTYINDGITTKDYAVYGTELPTPQKAGYTFKGWFDANGVKQTTVTGALNVTAAWTKTGNVDLTASDKIAGTAAEMTLDIPADAASALGVTIQGFNGILMNKDTEEVKTDMTWTGGASVSLEYSADNYVGLNKASKYIVNVEYDVASIDTIDRRYHPQIAILYNINTETQDNGEYILSAKKHHETVTDSSISCVVSGVTAKALRLAFDGQGAFNIKSVTVTEMPAGTVGLNAVRYVNGEYSTDMTVIAEKGTAVSDLPRTLLHNFGGWYNGEEKVTAVSGDATLTAKWFDKADITMNGETDVLDIIRIKKMLADKSTDILYDIDRDNVVAATDATVLKRTLLGVETATIGGNDIATYTVSSGDQASF